MPILYAFTVPTKKYSMKDNAVLTYNAIVYHFEKNQVRQ